MKTCAVLCLAGSGAGSIKARFENIAKQTEEEDRKRLEEERSRRQVKEKQEQEEARRKQKVCFCPRCSTHVCLLDMLG